LQKRINESSQRKRFKNNIHLERYKEVFGMSINVNKILRNNKSLLLACDQGLEHGPKDFNNKNIDPKYIFDIALEGNYDGVIVQNGLAEKYYGSYYREIPLIVKLNGKTNLTSNVISRQLCSVERAIKLGASAVGYTIFVGSPMEPEILHEFSKIVESAHDYGVPVIGWMYARGPTVKNELDKDILAYGARMGLELGADFLKLKYNNDPESYRWVVKCAGRSRVLVSGGDKIEELAFLKEAEEVMKLGVTGMAIGRNIWQHDKPLALTAALQKIIHEGKSAQEAIKLYEDLSKKEK